VPELNADIPRLYCYVRKEYLYDLQSHRGEFIKACIFGISSLYGKAVGFHALLENGAMIWRLPISALASDQEAPHQPLEILQLWDSFSYSVSVTEFAHLEGLRCRVLLKDKRAYEGEYVLTVDWYGSNDSEEPGDGGHKCAHLIQLDNGCFALQPNNRICWFEPAFVTPFTDPPDYRTNNQTWKCENQTRWYTADNDRYFYDIHTDPALDPEGVGQQGPGQSEAPTWEESPSRNSTPKGLDNRPQCRVDRG
jgi:hypothetical protein